MSETRIVPEGDERCDEPKDACRCMKRKGHDGQHECVHGFWRSEDSQEEVETQSEQVEARRIAQSGLNSILPPYQRLSKAYLALQAELDQARVDLQTAEKWRDTYGHALTESQKRVKALREALELIRFSAETDGAASPRSPSWILMVARKALAAQPEAPQSKVPVQQDTANDLSGFIGPEAPQEDEQHRSLKGLGL